MSKLEGLTIGLKVLGVYFGVLAASNLWSGLIVVLGAAGQHSASGAGAAVLAVLLSPVVYLVAAFVLVCKTSLCVAWCGVRDQPPPPA